MNPKWHPVNHVVGGGTVFDITVDSSGKTWVASPAGLFRGVKGSWLPVLRSLPFVQVSAITAVRKRLFAAGLPDGLVYSLDGGVSWNRAWTDQVGSPVTCFAVSPNYSQDNVLMGGTDGEGVLRSTDGGRHWTLSNFGLRGFSVFQLVSIGVPQVFRTFSHLKEVVFAGTDDGVYISPNGGRAWKSAGSETTGMVVLALALSPAYLEDQTLYAGTEDGVLLCSKDGGASWKTLELYGFTPGPINSLYCGEHGILVVGTTQAGILYSADGGESWQSVYPDPFPVLKVLHCDDRLYAGLYLGGLLVSADEGKTWEAVSGLAARRFEWLSVPSVDSLIAAGPGEGIWASTHDGKSWALIPGWSDGKVVLGLCAGENHIFAAAPDGVWRWSYPAQDGWTQVLGMERIASSAQELNSQFHLSCSSGFVLGGDGAHGLYLSDDSGDSWRKLETPFTGQLVIALAISPFFSEDHTLLVCAAGEGDRVVQLWISQDEGLSWSLRHSREADRFSARIAVSGKDASNAVLGLGEWVLYNDSEGWKTSVIATQSAPVSAVEVLPDSNIIVAATTDQVQYLTPAGSWAASDSLRDQAVVALVRSPTFNQDRTLYALRSDGMLIKGIFNLS